MYNFEGIFKESNKNLIEILNVAYPNIFYINLIKLKLMQ